MKKLALVFLAAIGLAAPAAAGQVQVGYSGSSYGPYQTGTGGEFTLRVISGLDTGAYAAGVTSNIGVAGTFQTFCIEENEYIYPYAATYTVNLNTAAVFGGVGGGVIGGDPLNPGGTGDPVSQGTGWLYNQFATGNWQNGLSYDYGSGRTGSAATLQQAFWYLEDEISASYVPGSNVYVDAAIAKFGSLADAKGGSATDYGVYALNLWTGTPYASTAGQDQLFYVPDGGTTLMLLGGALVGLAAVRRRFR